MPNDYDVYSDDIEYPEPANVTRDLAEKIFGHTPVKKYYTQSVEIELSPAFISSMRNVPLNKIRARYGPFVTEAICNHYKLTPTQRASAIKDGLKIFTPPQYGSMSDFISSQRRVSSLLFFSTPTFASDRPQHRSEQSQ